MLRSLVLLLLRLLDMRYTFVTARLWAAALTVVLSQRLLVPSLLLVASVIRASLVTDVTPVVAVAPVAATTRQLTPVIKPTTRTSRKTRSRKSISNHANTAAPASAG